MLVAAGVLASNLFATEARADGDTAELSVSVSEAVAGDTITVRGSGFRVGTDGSFIYSSTITVGGVPIAGVASVDPASGYLHGARTTESGLYVAEHIDIDPANTAPDGAFTAEIVLPHNIPVGDHYLQMTSCWGGPDGVYPEDGLAPCGTKGFGGGVNDRVAAALITVVAPPPAELSLNVSEAAAGDTITVRGSGFRVGTDGSFIYSSTITVGGVPIAGVASVDPASGYLHAARTTESGLFVAEHIDIDPANTAPDGAFTAEIVLPHNIPVGDHYLQMTSCWGGPDGTYPENGLAPCGTKGFGGGVNDRVAAALITIVAPVDDASVEAVVRGPAGEEGPRGPEGARGPQGLRGAEGPEGPQGPRGAEGPEGPQGLRGDEGAQGPQGPRGAEGPQGPQGLRGVDGRDGAQGPQGLPGRRGPAGSQSPVAELMSIIALVVAIIAVVGVAAVYILGRRPAGGVGDGS